jgi:flagellar biosynthetic protein FliO
MKFLICSAEHRKETVWVLILTAFLAGGSSTALAGSIARTESAISTSLVPQEGFLETSTLEAAVSEEESPATPQSEPPSEGAAVSPVSEESLSEAQSGSMGGYGIRAVGALIVVLGAIWFAMILLKRYMPHRFGPLGQKRRIQVLETVPIGEKRTLTLVRIDNEELLLASTPGSLSLLKEIRLERSTDTLVQEQNPAVGVREAFEGSVRGSESQKFEEVLADQVQSAQPTSGPLSRLTFLRQELEAR